MTCGNYMATSAKPWAARSQLICNIKSHITASPFLPQFFIDVAVRP